MTTDHDELLARLNDGIFNEKLKSALRAVVELEVPATFSTDASAHAAWLEGYNYRKDQDLEAIEKELG
jgi:hypothetical protein